jgi:protease-4
MRNKALLIALLLIVLIGGAFFAGMLAYLIAGGEGTTLAGSLGGKKVGVVTVEGPIISAKDTVEDIERFRKDGGIASVVLRIESPGGSVAAAQEILEAVKRLAKEKPVVASMGSVAASGGYYIACGATKILANPATITGSIGVRMEHVMIGDLLRWAKIDHETLKSGRFKDLAPIDRPMTPQERAIIQDMLVDMHQQFKEAVASARRMDLDQVDKLADGRTYTGRRALELGLIDELGGLAQAGKIAGELGGIKDEPKLVYPKKRFRLFDHVVTSMVQAMADRLAWDKWLSVLHFKLR